MYLKFRCVCPLFPDMRTQTGILFWKIRGLNCFNCYCIYLFFFFFFCIASTFLYVALQSPCVCVEWKWTRLAHRLSPGADVTAFLIGNRLSFKRCALITLSLRPRAHRRGGNGTRVTRLSAHDSISWLFFPLYFRHHSGYIVQQWVDVIAPWRLGYFFFFFVPPLPCAYP